MGAKQQKQNASCHVQQTKNDRWLDKIVIISSTCYIFYADKEKKNTKCRMKNKALLLRFNRRKKN